MLAAALGTLNTLGLSWTYWQFKRRDARDRQLRQEAAEIVSAGDERSAALEAAEQEHERRSEILAEVSHDLRAPLQGIIAYTDLVQQGGGLSPEQQQRLAVIRQEVTHMHGLADRVLDRISQLQAARLQAASIDVRAIVQQCCASARVLAAKKNLPLRAFIGEAMPDRVLSDAEALNAIVRNLLANAVAFTERGGIDIHIAYANCKLQIAVVDTGIGMSTEQVQRLLQSANLQTADQPRSRLGLNIVHRRTHRLGGSIGYQPTPGGGTTITIELPAEPVRTAEKQDATENGLRVLVVEDSQSIRVQFAEQLTRAGLIVTQASSGEEGLELAQQRAFDVILTDVNMRGIDGIEMARRIRASSGNCQSTPIIAVTAERPDGQIAMWRAAGVALYVQKPCQPRELLDAIRAVVADHGGFQPGAAA